MAQHGQLGILKVFALTGLGVLVFGAGGLGLVFSAWHDWRLLREAPYWPRTNGIVVESWLRRGTDSRASSVRIRYAYEIGAHRYEGDVRTAAVFFLDEEEVLAQHRVGASVPIHYDPENPGRSVLDAWLSWNHYWMWGAFIIGVVLVAVCGFMAGGLILGVVVLTMRAMTDRRSLDERQEAMRRLRPRR